MHAQLHVHAANAQISACSAIEKAAKDLSRFLEGQAHVSLPLPSTQLGLQQTHQDDVPEDCYETEGDRPISFTQL